MKSNIFLRVAVPTPLRRLFDYLPPEGFDCATLATGVRVKVPFGQRTLVGVLMEVVDKTEVPAGKLKQVLEVLDEEAVLPVDVRKICAWAAKYYHYSLGEVFAAAMPAFVRKGRPVMPPSVIARSAQRDAAIQQPGSPRCLTAPRADVLTLNTHQQAAVDAVLAAKDAFKTFLLDGVTGSGKTEVYLRIIEAVLDANAVPPAQVLVLVPEISLTPQTIARFEQRFPVPVAALHSGLTDKQRFEAWLKARSGEARIVIGTRSAVFTPFTNLSLIIIDEEHDSSFKQQDRFRYHARDLAIMRAQENNVPIVLGSATPSLETLLNARKKKFDYLPLPERAGGAAMPTFELIDLKCNKPEEGLSAPLIASVRKQLAANNQVMLFLNRRGFSPVLYCTQCAWIAECKRCDARMVYHQRPARLHCHHCDTRRAIPNACHACGEASLQPVGLGTQRLEEALMHHFPDTPIIRVDRDSTRKKGELHALLEKVHATPNAILLGTQMLAKGHHFPNVTLVGIVDADAGLFSADFRSAEQMGQLLLQVSGRAGREDKPGTVMVQTYHPDHPLLQTLIHEGYGAFATQLLSEREMATLPPYSYFAVLRAEAYKNKAVQDFLQTLIKGSESIAQAVSLLGPVPAVMAKKKGLHCENLVIKSSKRGALQQFLQKLVAHIEKAPVGASVKWVLDIDPVEV